MNLDEILHQVGDYGKYQKLMLWFVLLPAHLPFGAHYYSQVFMSLTPGHWCQGAAPQGNGSRSPITMWSRGLENSWRVTISECDLDNRTEKEIRGSNSTSRSCVYGHAFDRSVLYEEETVVTTWDLVCESAGLPSVALAIFFMGAFVGQWIYIFITNRFGKRASFFSFLGAQCLFGVAVAFSPDFLHFVILRFVVGLTSSAVISSPTSLAQELVGPKHRNQVSILSQSARSLGLMFLSIMAFLVRDWSQIALVTTLPFFAFFLYWWVFPESPSWLQDRGRYEEVGRAFEVIGQANGRELTPEYIINMKRRFRIEKSMLEERRKDGTHIRYCAWDLFRGSNLCKKTIAIIFIWFSSTAASVGLTLYSLEMPGDLYRNFFASAGAELVAAILVGVVARRCGRRLSFCLSSALGGVLTFSIACNSTGGSSSFGLFVAAKLSISSSCTVLPLWTGELLPVVVGSVGLQMTDAVSVAGPVILPFIFNQGRISEGFPLLSLGSLQVAGALAALVLPETLNQKRPLTLQDAEEFGKYRTWADCFCFRAPKQDVKNGILKNKGPQPQSPILSLLRRQDSLRRVSSEGDADQSDPQSEGSVEPDPFVDAVMITVV